MESDLARFGVLIAITVCVLVLAWLSRHVALDMDARGKSGWLYGVLTLFLPPLGLALWLLDRESTRDLGRLFPRPPN